ncbi:MAG TPA: glycoside hydrolase/phage tail family protein [Hyphomonadaceae bacterium]|nr:glycoside hydrolase/phage tail family protein [Hyphomonadaceae bacterium]
MAELVLGRLGAAAGAAILPKGLSFLGGALGRLAGAAIGERLAPPIEGPRVKEFHLTEGREGAGVSIVFGRCRVGGQLIWAAQFKERREVESGKGGPRVADYSYTLSFALALGEGEVAEVTRAWANGEPFDLSKATWRFYSGAEDQGVDPLIEAIEGPGAAPAYRGIAYIVFEDLGVDDFGAHMPQMSFEVVRPAAKGGNRLESVVRAVNLIPGAGEFALATDIVRRRTGPGRETAENLHGPVAKSDFEVSLDQLLAELPNLTRVNLVVAWFGNDLRCGECLIRPGVEISDKVTSPDSWSVAGVERADAYVVSATEGRPNYGGTPSDASTKQAVAVLKSRGLHVTLYPMLLMDIPPGNGLPDPSGGVEQPAFPWRGRITAAAGDVAVQVDTFFSRYRSFVLHYAELAAEIGADGMLIGSELVGLTRLSDGGAYPGVEALRVLASDVRAAVGPGVEISYGADWTEYGAQVAGDNVEFPLDALWADEAISYVGLDWYPSMADWRDGDSHADAAYRDSRSLAYLTANIAGGELFDWYYADEAGRLAQDRLTISDGGYGELFVFRKKDIAGWWSSPHYPRVGGVRSSTPTAWVAGMKPVRFVEMGCPAVDKGANQPNVFFDPKSSESALPYFSNGSRDDLIQRRMIEAFHAYWSEEGRNPTSGVYDGPMTPEDGIALWAWDARPYPAFPARDDVWGDTGNWRLGHWLNGRVGLALLSDVVEDLGARAGANVDASGLAGVVSGYQCDGQVSARAAMEPLTAVYSLEATERGDAIVFRMPDDGEIEVEETRLVEDDAPPVQLIRSDMETSERRVRVRFIDVGADGGPGIVVSAGPAAASMVEVEAALSLDRDQAQRCADALAEQAALKRERVRFAMAADGAVLEAGDVARIDGEAWRIAEVSDGTIIRFEAVRAGSPTPFLETAAPVAAPSIAPPVEPDAVVVDGPPLPGEEDDIRPLGFAFAQPWIGALTFSAGGDLSELKERGRVAAPCAIGRLTTELYPHVSGRWQEASVWVALPGPAPSSRTEGAVLNGANAALVATEAGWELLQFRDAELVDTETYKLSYLLRGQQGSEEAAAAGAAVGSRIFFLGGAEQRLDVADWERGLSLKWRAWRDSPAEETAWNDDRPFEAQAGRTWSPCHFAGDWSGGDLQLSWIRRARKGGDPWVPGEPPLESAENYRVRVSASGVTKRQWEVGAPSATYTAADQATDFPSGADVLIEAAQIGPDGEPGDWTRLSIAIPAP